MENSLKLSYHMLFDNGSYESETDDVTAEEPKLLTPEEVESLLDERDQEWETRLDDARSMAYQQGVQEGIAQGKAEAEATFNERLTAIRNMMAEMDQEFNQALEKLKPHMASLVFEIIEKVLDVPFHHPKMQTRVQDEITKFVELLDEELHVKVSVSPKNFKTLEQAIGSNHNAKHVTLRADESCKPGEYVIETKRESIIKNFKKMVADFKESISFGEVDNPELG